MLSWRDNLRNTVSHGWGRLVFLISLAVVTVVLAGCTSTATTVLPTSTPIPPPTQTAIPTSTSPPTEIPSPTVTATPRPSPTPTRTPPPTRTPFTCPKPATGDGPPFTKLPEREKGPVLAQVLARLPASFRDKGIWFSNPAGSVELAGAPDPSNTEEFVALSETDSKAFLGATRGLVVPSNMLQRSRQEYEKWSDAFGFDFLAASRLVSTGFDEGNPFGTTYAELKFDTADIRQHLLDLGYQQCVAAGGVYYAIRHDREQDLHDPVARIASSTMNRVVLGDSWMATSPDTDPVVAFLDVAAGADTLLDEPAIASMAAELGDPLSAVFLTRELALLELDSPTVKPDPPVRLPKPEHWGQTHTWEYLAAGFGITEGQPWWKLVLSYPDPNTASADIDELSRRWEEYQLYTWLSQRDPQPLTELCPSPEFDAWSDQDRSVLTVHCPLQERTSVWFVMLEMRDLGFLLP